MSNLPDPVIRIILGYYPKFRKKLDRERISMNTLKWYIKILQLDSEPNYYDTLFMKACCENNLSVTNWLLQEEKLNANYLSQNHLIWLDRSYKYGNLELIRFLDDKFDLYGNDRAKPDVGLIIHTAIHGSPKMATWLANRTNQTSEYRCGKIFAVIICLIFTTFTCLMF